MCSRIVTLNEVCRACLIKKHNMKPLVTHDDELIKKFTSLLHSEIQMTDQFPCYLCNECEEKLDISFQFQQLCQQSFHFIISCGDNLKPAICNDEDISKSAKYNEISIINVNVEQILDTDSKNSISKEIEENEKTNLNSKLVTEKHLKSSNKQIMKLSQYPQEEVNSIIRSIKEKMFLQQDCLYCNFTAKGSRSLSFHMSRLHQEYKKTWCSKCNRSVTNLSEHRQNIHEDDLKCCFCAKNFGTTSHLLEHLACHTVDRKYECDVCEKRFISARHLKAHSKVHYPKKKYRCLVCPITVWTKQSLTAHLKSHKMNRCKVCEGIFHASDYESHKCFEKNDAKTKIKSKENEKSSDSFRLKQVGGDEMKELCVYCGKKFRTPSKLSVHVRVHTGETPYQCSYCEARMTTRTHLVVHERTHTGEKPYVCDICGKGFAQSSVLNTHKKIHTGRTEQCLLCPKKFCRPSELKQHTRKHTGEKPFLCEYCNKAFVQRSHLVGHLWTHIDERPFKCQLCEKGFKQASTLKTHLNIHTGKKSYQCSQCTFSSGNKYSLQQHLLQHHQLQEEISYRCEMCDLTFQNIAVFTSHCSDKHEVSTFSSGDKLNFVKENAGEQHADIIQLLY